MLDATANTNDENIAQLQSLTNSMGNLENELSVTAEERQSALQEAKDLTDAISVRDRDIGLLNQRISELTDELADLQSDSSLQISEQDQQLSLLKQQLSAVTDERDSLLKESSDLAFNLDAVNDNVLSLKQQRVAARLQVGNLDGENSKLSMQLDAARSEGTEANEKVQVLLQEIENMQSSLDDANSNIETLEGDKKSAADAITFARLEAEELRGSLADQLAQAGITGVDVQELREDNSVSIRLGTADLFTTGSAFLSREGSVVLKKVADILAKYKDRHIEIEGHTDNVPIGPELRKRFESNWELSVARAATAVRFVQWQSAIDPTRLSAKGFGEYYPVSSNATESGRVKNRRVEIVMHPAKTK